MNTLLNTQNHLLGDEIQAIMNNNNYSDDEKFNRAETIIKDRIVKFMTEFVESDNELKMVFLYEIIETNTNIDDLYDEYMSISVDVSFEYYNENSEAYIPKRVLHETFSYYNGDIIIDNGEDPDQSVNNTLNTRNLLTNFLFSMLMTDRPAKSTVRIVNEPVLNVIHTTELFSSEKPIEVFQGSDGSMNQKLLN